MKIEVKWSDVRTRSGKVFDSCPYIDEIIEYLQEHNADFKFLANMEYIRAIAKELRGDFERLEDEVYENKKKIEELEEIIENADAS
jgi:predicted nuclease with TOPRIM domain